MYMYIIIVNENICEKWSKYIVKKVSLKFYLLFFELISSNILFFRDFIVFYIKDFFFVIFLVLASY